jgi:ActR/RegA family two-component response regulator
MLDGRHEEQESAPRKRLRLLLVDDEKGFVEVLAKRLAKRNIHTTQAFSGTEGIQPAQAVRFRCGRAGPEAGGHGRHRNP